MEKGVVLSVRDKKKEPTHKNYQLAPEKRFSDFCSTRRPWQQKPLLYSEVFQNIQQLSPDHAQVNHCTDIAHR